MKIPQELVDSIVRGNAVLFVGAGFSIEAGLPGRNELLDPLAENIGLPVQLRANPLRVAQHYQNKLGRQSLIRHILEQINSTDKKPTENHRRLTRLGIRTWVTTNYDILLEQTLREIDERYSKVVSDQDLPYISSDSTTLVKLHGDCEQPGTLVITQQDYETYFRRYPRVKEKLSGLLVDKTFFFIGYSINDPDFNQIQAEVAFDLKQHQRSAYAVLFDIDEFSLSDLRTRNIHVLNISTSNQVTRAQQLGTLLDELTDAVNKSRQHRVQRQLSTNVIPSRSQFDDIEELLQAMGYHVNSIQRMGKDLYFFCFTKLGANVHEEIISFMDRGLTTDDIAKLNDVVISHNAEDGILLTREHLPAPLQNFAQQLKHICCYTLDEFIGQLADFRPYLQRLVENHEASGIPQLYVPLAANIELGDEHAPLIFKPLEFFVDSWISESGHNHLSVLGDFGSGKTWFCQHYAYLAAKRYLADPVHNRIPILITLRDYSRAYNIEQLITDALVNRFKVKLAAGYKTFARLNEAGRLLLIFDGFDEMERRVSDNRTAVDNFWELARVVRSNSKVLLTCRTAYFRHKKEERATLVLERDHIRQAAIELESGQRDYQRFELVHLLDFTDEDIRLALQKQLPVEWERFYDKIQSLTNLRDLASRPVLLDMIVKTLPEMHETHLINQSKLYQTYVDKLLLQRSSEDSDYLSPEVRRFLIQELAWEMYHAQKFTCPFIPFSDFPEWVKMHFDIKNALQGLVEFVAQDMRTQSYLVRDDNGNYRFSHKSFLEYFVACKMASVIDGPNFNMQETIEIWKTQALTPEVSEFLKNMVTNSARLWHLIRATQAMVVADAGYAGGNAATLLHLQGASFIGENLSRTILTGADFHNGNLSKATLRGACLRRSNLRNCTLEQADMREADLTQVHIGEMGSVEAVMFDPSGEIVISGSSDGIVRLWNWANGNQVGQFLAGTDVISINSDGKSILAGVGQNGHIKMWDRESGKLATTFIGHTASVWKISYCPSMQCFASGSHDGTIRIWDLHSYKQLRAIDRQGRGVWDICYSSDGASIAAAGGSELGIYDSQTGKLLWTAPEQTAEFRNVKYSNNNVLAYTTREGNIILRDAISKQLILRIKGTIVGPNSIAFSSNGLMLAVGDSGPNVKVQVWDVQAGTIALEGITNSKGYVGMIHWGINQCLVSGSSDGSIRIWDATPNNLTFMPCLRMLEARINCRNTLIDGAKGLDVSAPDSKGTLHNWFMTRGASEWPPFVPF